MYLPPDNRPRTLPLPHPISHRRCTSLLRSRAQTPSPFPLIRVAEATKHTTQLAVHLTPIPHLSIDDYRVA